MGSRRAVVAVVVVLGAAVGLVGLATPNRPPVAPLGPATAGTPLTDASAVRTTRSARPEAPRGDGPSDGLREVLRVLHGWDARRAAAYADGSPTALRDLYTPGSSAGAADVRLLQGYRARGFRVVGLRTQVLALTVLARRADRCTVRVTDRVVGAVAVRAGRRLPLPRDVSSTRVVALVRGGDDRWRVAQVSDAPPVRPGAGRGVGPDVR